MTDTPPPTDPIEPTTTEPDATGLEADDRNLLLLANGLGIILLAIPAVVIWLLKKDERPAVAGPLKDTVNFQLTVFIACFALVIVTTLTAGLAACITGPLLFLIWVATVIFLILAALDANKGKVYKFPFKLNLLK